MRTTYYMPLLVLSFVVRCAYTSLAQVKIGTTPGPPNNGAMLEIESNTRGFLPPRIYLTSTSMLFNGVLPLEGTMIYSNNWTGNGNLGGMFVWKNNFWQKCLELVPASHIRVVQNTSQTLSTGNNLLSWNEVSQVRQPAGDDAMWTVTNPTKVIIRRAGWYVVSASLRIEGSAVGSSRYLAISHQNAQITASGVNTPGVSGTSNTITLNTSTMVLCKVNDEISVISYSSNSASTAAWLGTTQLTVTQLPMNLF